jgi:toxin-antitoxin system PIN domain toxin
VILPDVNVLVQALQPDAAHHVLCRKWLDRVITADSRFGVSPQVLSAVVRIATHPRIFPKPTPLVAALQACEFLLQQPHCVVIQPGLRHWEIFSNLCVDADARGNLVTDAWFAALAIESGCEWITLDRDYARFKGLRWSTPAQS